MWGWFKKSAKQPKPEVKVEDSKPIDKAEGKKSTRKFLIDGGVTHIAFRKPPASEDHNGP